MSKALVLAEHDQGALRASTHQVVTAALKAAGSVDILVAGHQLDAVAQAAASIDGVARVVVVDAPQLADGLGETLANQIVALAGGYTHLFAASSSIGKNVMPRVAATLDCAQLSDIIAVHDANTFDRPIYAGNAIATVQTADRVVIATVRTTSFDPTGTGGQASVERVDAVADAGLSAFVSREVAKSDRPDLQTAKVVVSGGRGMGSADNFSVLDALATRLNAAIGASRAAVDAGYAPNDWQVGQTGKIVAPQLYIAVGISGAIQHLAGMKDSKVIVAINKNADEPIFQVADYGLVADLFEAVPELCRQLDA
jgi:electron transfer flavoprotein alpha subunit